MNNRESQLAEKHLSPFERLKARAYTVFLIDRKARVDTLLAIIALVGGVMLSYFFPAIFPNGTGIVWTLMLLGVIFLFRESIHTVLSRFPIIGRHFRS